MLVKRAWAVDEDVLSSFLCIFVISEKIGFLCFRYPHSIGPNHRQTTLCLRFNSTNASASFTEWKKNFFFHTHVTCMENIQRVFFSYEKFFFLHSHTLLEIGACGKRVKIRQSEVCLWLGSIERGYLKHKNPIFSEKTKMH